jgi:membrane protease YdiL (CAAX protease family)
LYQAVSLVVLDPLASHLTGVRQDLSIFAGIRGNVRLLVRYLMMAWTLAAFGEEFVFRGYLLNRIAQLWKGSHGAFCAGIVFSSILWTSVHFYQGIAGVVLVAVHGFVFGLLYVLAGRNLWVTIVAHGVYDTTALLLIFFGRYPNLGS